MRHYKNLPINPLYQQVLQLSGQIKLYCKKLIASILPAIRFFSTSNHFINILAISFHQSKDYKFWLEHQRMDCYVFHTIKAIKTCIK